MSVDLVSGVGSLSLVMTPTNISGLFKGLSDLMNRVMRTAQSFFNDLFSFFSQQESPMHCGQLQRSEVSHMEDKDTCVGREPPNKTPVALESVGNHQVSISVAKEVEGLLPEKDVCYDCREPEAPERGIVKKAPLFDVHKKQIVTLLEGLVNPGWFGIKGYLIGKKNEIKDLMSVLNQSYISALRFLLTDPEVIKSVETLLVKMGDGGEALVTLLTIVTRGTSVDMQADNLLKYRGQEDHTGKVLNLMKLVEDIFDCSLTPMQKVKIKELEDEVGFKRDGMYPKGQATPEFGPLLALLSQVGKNLKSIEGRTF